MKQLFKKRLSQFGIFVQLLTLGNFIPQPALAIDDDAISAINYASTVMIGGGCAYEIISAILGGLGCPAYPCIFGVAGAGYCGLGIAGRVSTACYRRLQAQRQRQEEERQRAYQQARRPTVVGRRNASGSHPTFVIRAEVFSVPQLAAPPQTALHQLPQDNKNPENNHSPNIAQAPGAPRVSGSPYNQTSSSSSASTQ